MSESIPDADEEEPANPPTRKTLTRDQRLVELAQQRAAVRAEMKAARAAEAGLILPTPKKTRGWQLLRERLKNGELLPSLLMIRETEADMSTSVFEPRRASLKPSNIQSVHEAYVALQARHSAVAKFETEQLFKESKLVKERNKKKQQQRTEQRKLLKKRRLLERELEYLHFPSILGWYFDGFFTPRFLLNEEYAAIFNLKEVKLSRKKEKSIKETFAEKAKRYFWPPEILSGICFRSRGIYLDFKDIIRDPPHTPPDIAIGQRGDSARLFKDDSKVTVDITPKVQEIPGARGEEIEAVAVNADPSREIEIQLLMDAEAALAAEEERVKKEIQELENNPKLSAKDKANKKRELLKALQKKKDKVRVQRQAEKNKRKKLKEKKRHG